jgi:hypothetical protein
MYFSLKKKQLGVSECEASETRTEVGLAEVVQTHGAVVWFLGCTLEQLLTTKVRNDS